MNTVDWYLFPHKSKSESKLSPCTNVPAQLQFQWPVEHMIALLVHIPGEQA